MAVAVFTVVDGVPRPERSGVRQEKADATDAASTDVIGAAATDATDAQATDATYATDAVVSPC